jgi:hypothetical protein
LVRQALMVALSVIMGDEILNGCPQRLFAEGRSCSLMLRTNLSA